MTLTPAHAQSALGGGTGLINIPSAQVLAEGDGTFQYTRFTPDIERTAQTEAWYAGAGFAPGLELGGRAIASAVRVTRRDLSVDAKYRLPWTAGGVALALGAQDVGGVERLLPREYAVATWSHPYVDVTAGYGRGRNVLDGPFGGVALKPWPWIAALVEHDADHANAGLRLTTPAARTWRASATAAWRGATEEVDYAVQVGFGFGGTPRVIPSEARDIVDSNGDEHIPRFARDDTSAALRATLLHLGFEGVRVGRRGDTLVVQLENRRYNHSAADGIGVALGAIADTAGPRAARVELYPLTYGVPQIKVAALCHPERSEGYAALGAREDIPRFARDDTSAARDDTGCAVHAEPADAIANAPAITWDAPATRLTALELVAEPVLRTAVATEHGMLDYAAGVRARLTAPLARGLIANLGAAAPVAHSDDFAGGRVFEDLAIRPGVDLATLQYLHTPVAGWTWLWSAGRARVFQVDTTTLALEQAWMPGAGRHRWRAKLMAMRSDAATREVALAGYNWLDAARRYGIGLTAGRFYAGDGGARVDIERYFGDTILGLYYKFASSDDQAAGVTLSLPLTPRRDAYPRGLQLKGARRWTHALGTTLNGPPAGLNRDGSNPIRPLLLYEPTLELDLERDIQDSGRLNEEWLSANRERMREAYELFR